AEFDVLTANSAQTAQAMFAQRPVDIVLTDQRMPQMTGVQLLEWVRQCHPRTIRLLMTGYAELADTIDTINRAQAYYYFIKPLRDEELLQVLHNAADKCLLERGWERGLEEQRRLLEQQRQDLERLFQERTRELQQTNHLLQQQNRELQTLAKTDPLTELLNRR